MSIRFCVYDSQFNILTVQGKVRKDKKKKKKKKKKKTEREREKDNSTLRFISLATTSELPSAR